ncbi:hypothetical protein [Streptomyces sp. NPDC048192]|uniref:hypothetical protein n=1 Tax=Streptomyces sp. NPDC048192 TaxID=3365510 RepID=UPI0037241994
MARRALVDLEHGRTPAGSPPGAAGAPPAAGGDSAGGTLAACAALARRARNEPLTAQVRPTRRWTPAAPVPLTRGARTRSRPRTTCGGRGGCTAAARGRPYADLRDGTHGEGGDTVTRQSKERHFERAVELLHPYAVQVLQEFDAALLLNTGEVTASGVRRTADGGLGAEWTLS